MRVHSVDLISREGAICTYNVVYQLEDTSFSTVYEAPLCIGAQAVADMYEAMPERAIRQFQAIQPENHIIVKTPSWGLTELAIAGVVGTVIFFTLYRNRK